MHLIKRKKLTKILTAGTILSTFLIKSNMVFAGGIGTAEVETATENIKRVITSIAMPLGRSFDFCKYSNCSY